MVVITNSRGRSSRLRRRSA